MVFLFLIQIFSPNALQSIHHFLLLTRSPKNSIQIVSFLKSNGHDFWSKIKPSAALDVQLWLSDVVEGPKVDSPPWWETNLCQPFSVSGKSKFNYKMQSTSRCSKCHGKKVCIASKCAQHLLKHQMRLMCCQILAYKFKSNERSFLKANICFWIKLYMSIGSKSSYNWSV